MCFWYPLESTLDKDDSHLAIFGSTNLGVIFLGLKIKNLKNKKMGHFFTMKPCSGRKKIGWMTLLVYWALTGGPTSNHEGTCKH
jgi:hypothetical protein